MAPSLKFKRALKSAARFPVRAVSGSRSNAFAPLPNELPLVTLRLQVLSCTNLLAKDKSGTSDPFVVVSVLNTRNNTPVVKRSLNPTYTAKDATFDFPIYASLAEKLGAVELVVWDKDFVSKDYLGEVAIPLEDWFADGRSFGFDDLANKPFSVNLESTRANTPATGTIQVKLGFTSQPDVKPHFDEIFADLVKHSRPSLVSAPPTGGVGTVRSRSGPGHLDVQFVFEEDGGLFSDESDDSSDEADEDQFYDALEGNEGNNRPAIPLSKTLTPPERRQTEDPVQHMPSTPQLTIHPSSPLTPTQTLQLEAVTPVAPPATKATPRSKMFPLPIPLPRRISGLTSSTSTSGSTSPIPLSPSLSTGMPGSPIIPTDPGNGEVVPETPVTEKEKKKRLGGKFRRSWGGGSLPGTPTTPSSALPASDTQQSLDDAGEGNGRKSKIIPGVRRKGKGGRSYSFDAGNDILGIVMLEIGRVEDLPKVKNMTRMGWDMDPFVVCSFGKKVFRTRVIRHSLNPVFEEKLLFQVCSYETSFRVQLSVHDWDKLSSNDHIGEAGFEVSELIEKAPQKEEETGLYPQSADGSHDMVEYKLKVEAKDAPWGSGANPTIYMRAKFQPYDLLRQRFWRQYLKQYDTDDTGKISHLELTAMLDSLGSTLTKQTVDGFWTQSGKPPHEDELTMEELISRLEDTIGKPESQRRRVEEGGTSASPTPAHGAGAGQTLDLEKLDFSGPPHVRAGEEYETQPSGVPLSAIVASRSVSSSSYSSDDAAEDSGTGSVPLTPRTVRASDPNAAFPSPAAKKGRFRKRFRVPKVKEGSSGSSGSGSSGSGSDDSMERVINVKNCPLCHRPRMSSKAEMDIVTHLAVCASQDWNKVDRIMVGNFVTASQAQRKWYTKIITKVSSGDYRLGANSANIIVQNRITGQLEEEKMQVYVRLGIRLLYKGATSRMEGGRARRLLKSLSIKQGLKYDSPQSAADIPAFIEFHGLNMNEVLDPLDSFKTFNQFFYRKLKPPARPVEKQDDPYRLVSAADCRLMTFATVDEATRLWIKGREFTVARLLGPAYKDQVEKYAGGALAIFRLAPQDYHRYHSPVDGRIGAMTVIAGEYYTVNPQAIRSSLDVYGENVRKIVPIDSRQFGRVMAVCIGAMMVGSIKTTVAEGDYVVRGQEFGYFAFGGSTIVVLFEKGAVEWDEDLLINGRASLETLVRVGMGIGNGRRASVPAA